MVLSTWKVSLRLRALLAFLLAFLLFGCSSRVPVSGKLTVENKPLTNGSIFFVPDRDKGNMSTAEPRGTIDDQGNYTLSTDGKPGVPPGWYRVVVVVSSTNIPDIRNPTTTQSPIDERYKTATKTNLVVEVPGGDYNFKLDPYGKSPSGAAIPVMPK